MQVFDLENERGVPTALEAAASRRSGCGLAGLSGLSAAACGSPPAP